MSVILTPQACDRVRFQLQSHGSNAGLRLGVKASGCSGWSYVMGIADTVGEHDCVFIQDGIQVVIDKSSLPMLEGVELDYVREGLNARFRFNNPNVKDACGCGESFTV